MTKLIAAFALSALISTCALTAQAGLIANVQFNRTTGHTYTGAAVVGSEGDYWNDLLTGTDSDVVLYDIGNNASDLTLSWTGTGVATAKISGYYNGFASTGYANLMNGYLYLNNTSSTNHIIISGLTASLDYSIYIYSTGDAGCTGRQLTVNLNDSGAVTTAPAVASASTFILNQNYLMIDVLSSAMGQIDIAYSSAISEADINGIQIVSSVPEPASTALLLSGSLGLLVFWRKSKTRKSQQ